MEVKVGQIWRNVHTERDRKVIFVGRYDVTLADEEGTFSDGLWKFEKGIYTIVSDSPLSDLEIVQKALDEGEVLTLWGDKIWCVESRYKDNVSGCHLESLLIWAKEQVGESL